MHLRSRRGCRVPGVGDIAMPRHIPAIARSADPRDRELHSAGVSSADQLRTLVSLEQPIDQLELQLEVVRRISELLRTIRRSKAQVTGSLPVSPFCIEHP